MKTAIVIGGVTGCGKTTLSHLIEDKVKQSGSRISVVVVDADDYHSIENKEKMARGIGLTDQDRGPWLQAVAWKVIELLNSKEVVIIACSVLKKSYRDLFRSDFHKAGIKLIYWILNPSRKDLEERLAKRMAHFATGSLLDSQFNDFQIPEITLEPDCLVQDTFDEGDIQDLIHSLL